MPRAERVSGEQSDILSIIRDESSYFLACHRCVCNPYELQVEVGP